MENSYSNSGLVPCVTFHVEQDKDMSHWAAVAQRIHALQVFLGLQHDYIRGLIDSCIQVYSDAEYCTQVFFDSEEAALAYFLKQHEQTGVRCTLGFGRMTTIKASDNE